jgi:histidinol dehydrogenase
VHVVEYDERALDAVATHVTNLAEAEDLPGHAEAVRVRFDDRADDAAHPGEEG